MPMVVANFISRCSEIWIEEEPFRVEKGVAKPCTERSSDAIPAIPPA
jgi:hypothetical protein